MLRSSQPRRQASLRMAAIAPRRSSRPRAEWIVFDACSITLRLCSTRHFATGTSPIAGMTWALRRDSRPWMVRGALPRCLLSSMYSAPSAAIV